MIGCCASPASEKNPTTHVPSTGPRGVCPIPDIVALVIAENIDIAQDAANLIDINYEILEPTIETEFATSENKTPVWSEAPNNISFTHKTGNSLSLIHI